jgi:ADP-heptose:LPS heptosyltransferase
LHGEGIMRPGVNLLRELSPRSVVVLRALQLGDLLCAVPAFRALRAALPEAHIVLVGLPWARVFVERYPEYLDGFREFPGWPGLPERAPDVARIPAFLAEIQAERFDLALQLHGSGPFVNPLTALLGARHTAGFCLPGGYCPDPEWFLPWPDRGLEAHRLLKLMAFLGAPADDDRLEFPLRDGDFAVLSAWEEAEELHPGPYVCVHAGASVPERRWPAHRFAAAADALAARGFRVVLTGTGAEAELTRTVAHAMRHKALDLAGRTDLGAAAALIAGARLLLCNDTGVSHLAAALRTPSVVISTGDNPARWAPTDGARHRVLCRDGGVAVDDVLAEADRLLRRFAPARARAEAAAV